MRSAGGIVRVLSESRSGRTPKLTAIGTLAGLFSGLLGLPPGPLRQRQQADALLVGGLSIAGAAGGVALANALSGSVLRDAFAALMALVALQLARRAPRG